MADDTTTLVGEAEDTRERISATIDELQDRLNPRRIVGDAVGSVQSGGADFLNHAVGLVRAHPGLAAAAGLAVGLVLLGSNRLSKATVDLGDTHESYSDYDDDYSLRASEPANERFALLRGKAGARIEDNPIVAIVVGVAAGALLGALFPETERERRLLGASASKVSAAAKAAVASAREELATARDKVADVTTHAKSAVQSVVGAAKSELGG